MIRVRGWGGTLVSGSVCHCRRAGGVLTGAILLNELTKKLGEFSLDLDIIATVYIDCDPKLMHDHVDTIFVHYHQLFAPPPPSPAAACCYTAL